MVEITDTARDKIKEIIEGTRVIRNGFFSYEIDEVIDRILTEFKKLVEGKKKKINEDLLTYSLDDDYDFGRNNALDEILEELK